MNWQHIWMLGAMPLMFGLIARFEVHYLAGISTGYWLFMLFFYRHKQRGVKNEV